MDKKIKTYREIITEELQRVYELHGKEENIEYWNRISKILANDLLDYEEQEKNPDISQMDINSPDYIFKVLKFLGLEF